MTSAARIYQLMVLTAWADGSLHALEQGAAGKLLAETPELQELPGRDELARLARELLAAKGVRAAVAEVAADIHDASARKLAVHCCARVLAADGHLATEEFAVISELRRAFGLTLEETKAALAGS